MTQVVSKSEKAKILRTQPFNQGFHFAEKGNYTAVTATSLSDFASKLETVSINSVVFHYPRGDFQRWIQDTLGDEELANRMCNVKSDISPEKLREELLSVVQKRIKELEKE